VSEQAKNPFDLLVDQIRAVVREEIAAALKTESNGQHNVAHKDWLKADEAAQLYGLPKTWFEQRGRAGDIERSKPGRYVLFNRRDIEAYLEKNKTQSL
jgi:excisionase family DNA binding protein